MARSRPVFQCVSEWIAAGNMATGYYCLERVASESAGAVGFTADKFNAVGNLCPATCWIPRSQMQEVDNDYYPQGPARMYLVPAWLYQRRMDEGFLL